MRDIKGYRITDKIDDVQSTIDDQILLLAKDKYVTAALYISCIDLTGFNNI